MIRAQNHSSYPKAGENPWDQQLLEAERAFEAGEWSAQQVDDVVDEVTTIVVAEQARSFIDIVTDGMVRWAGPCSHLIRGMSGVRAGGLQRWLDTAVLERCVEVTAALARSGPITLGDYEVASGVALSKPVKCVLPGAVTFARRCHDLHYGDLDRLADAVAAVLADEVAALAAAGATWFQLDEPLLCQHPEDLGSVARTATRVFAAAGPEATTILSTYGGDLTGSAGDLEQLPGTHLGLDLVAGPANFGLLDRIPQGRGLALGLFDASSTAVEDAEDVASRLTPHLARLMPHDVLVGPNRGLESLPRDVAFDKLLHARYLVERLGPAWTGA